MSKDRKQARKYPSVIILWTKIKQNAIIKTDWKLFKLEWCQENDYGEEY